MICEFNENVFTSNLRSYRFDNRFMCIEQTRTFLSSHTFLTSDLEENYRIAYIFECSVSDVNCTVYVTWYALMKNNFSLVISPCATGDHSYKVVLPSA
jgi:hypothetical protein